MKCFYHSADLDGKCSAAIVMTAGDHKGAAGFQCEELPFSKKEPYL